MPSLFLRPPGVLPPGVLRRPCGAHVCSIDHLGGTWPSTAGPFAYARHTSLLSLVHALNDSDGNAPPEGLEQAEPGAAAPAPSTFLTGNAYLLAVSVLWGSYTPALRAIFTLPGGPAPLVVAAARGVIQATVLGVALALGRPDPGWLPEREPGERFLSVATLGSLEIGMYNTMGTLLQTWGLSVSEAFYYI